MNKFIAGRKYTRADLSREHLCVEDNGSLYLDAIEDGEVTGDIFFIDDDPDLGDWKEA